MMAGRKTSFAEESAEVEVLYANMEKLNGLTKRIQGSLNRLETHERSVEDAMRPIYASTEKIQVANTSASE